MHERMLTDQTTIRELCPLVIMIILSCDDLAKSPPSPHSDQEIMTHRHQNLRRCRIKLLSKSQSNTSPTLWYRGTILL